MVCKIDKLNKLATIEKAKDNKSLIDDLPSANAKKKRNKVTNPQYIDVYTVAPYLVENPLTTAKEVIQAPKVLY